MQTKQSLRWLIAGGCVVLGLAAALNAQASVVVGGTRLVYDANEAEATIKLSNDDGKSPALVQSWVDTGDIKAAPSAIDAPFTVTPPIARIDPGKGQTLRVVFTGEPQPQDRESVFWLNVLEVPPKPGADQADTNKLQLAFRTRIKLFYRPAGLKGSSNDAPRQIGWQLTYKDGRPFLEARNPTPYYVSFSAIEARSGGKTIPTNEAGMVAPMSNKVFPLKSDLPAAPDAKVFYSVLNDWGGSVEGDAALKPDNTPATN
ncbi:fimbria/pilus periplasmic chaperone [Burkholderia semiarida]|uniref:Fimbria/pilus periplasmic chaperone n=1 Tax=Burkholderia semiarida TaxID=2843303 RepID=A0ABW7L9X1_9BURK